MRKAKSIEELLPWLYLKDISTGDFHEARAALLGPNQPDLAEVLDRLSKDRPFLATQKGTMRSTDGLGNLMQRWTENAKMPHGSAHRLRKACARRPGEAGATAHQICAVTGHKTLAIVQRCTEAADREGKADSTIEKLITRPNGERNLANLPGRFDNSNTNPKQEKENWCSVAIPGGLEPPTS